MAIVRGIDTTEFKMGNRGVTHWHQKHSIYFHVDASDSTIKTTPSANVNGGILKTMSFLSYNKIFFYVFFFW